MVVVEVVPTHLIHANGKNGLKFRVNASIDNLPQKKFINKEHSRVPQIKQNNVA
ncbi:hypothetical protein SDC9_124208 [bioreactor metagenome]|uniref:Uncharacterized protein n=1 Tax=bioreactor metagenome TaxID=1076179 RepID=A0A645CJX7_9ZZZZ